MKYTIFTIFIFAIVQLNFAQYATTDLVYRCDFNEADLVWKSYKQKAFLSNTVKGRFQHYGIDQIWSQTSDMTVNMMYNHEVEVSLCQSNGVDNKGYGIIYNYKGSDNSNSFLH